MMDDDECGVMCLMIGKEAEIRGENLPQCHFVHHKSHMTWPRIEQEPILQLVCETVESLKYWFVKASFSMRFLLMHSLRV
jgi:hypothetical protein